MNENYNTILIILSIIVLVIFLLAIRKDAKKSMDELRKHKHQNPA